MNGSSLNYHAIPSQRNGEKCGKCCHHPIQYSHVAVCRQERGTDINKWRSVGVGVYIVHGGDVNINWETHVLRHLHMYWYVCTSPCRNSKMDSPQSVGRLDE